MIAILYFFKKLELIINTHVETHVWKWINQTKYLEEDVSVLLGIIEQTVLGFLKKIMLKRN